MHKLHKHIKQIGEIFIYYLHSKFSKVKSINLIIRKH